MNAGGASSSPTMIPPPFWSTPTPYLFIGFAVVMSLIAVALAVLLCSRRREGGREDEEAVPAGMMSVRVLTPLDREVPKVVVVMAGDDMPSFLASATPLDFAEAAKVQRSYCQCGAKDVAAAV
ncbi:hypothetical protein ZWY2020_025390 [Hordeum vulgare]|nr:hypothetical protein ZWY2020_025390 [Hordeum vulgare]